MDEPSSPILRSLARLSRPSPSPLPALNLRAALRRPLLLPTALFAAVMLFLGLVPRSATPAWLARINDKLLHFSCFGLLSVLCVLAWELEDLAPVDADLDTRHWGVLLAAKRAMRTKAGLTAAGMVAMGVGSEFAQGILSPSRTFDVDDIAFNLLGIAVGIPLGALADKWYTSRLTGTDYAPV